MRTLKIEGVVIKRRNYGEADRLVTVFTRYQGKLLAKASGVRKITSKRSAHIELLNYSNLTLHKHGSAYPLVTEADTIESFSAIKDDLTLMGEAYHICELLDVLCPEGQEQREIFDKLLVLLKALGGTYKRPPHKDSPLAGSVDEWDFSPRSIGMQANDGVQTASLIHQFEIDLLTQLGYWNHDPQAAPNLNVHEFIESIIEKRLKSKRIFRRLE